MKIKLRIVICVIFIFVFDWHICEVHQTLSSFDELVLKCDEIDIQLQNIQEQLDSLMIQERNIYWTEETQKQLKSFKFLFEFL